MSRTSKALKQRFFLIALIVTLSSVQSAPASAAGAGTPDAETAQSERYAVTDIRNASLPSAVLAAADAAEDAPQLVAQVAAVGPVGENVLGETVEPAAVGSIDLGNGGAAVLYEASLLPNDDGNVVAFTLRVTNSGSGEIDFQDYAVRLANKSGSKIALNLQAKDKDKRYIPAGTSLDLHYYAKVGHTVTLKDLVFSVIKWDFSVADFERPLGSIVFPEDYSDSIPASKTRIFEVSGTTVNAGITKVVMNSSDEYYVPTIYFYIRNVGVKNAAFDGYLFYVRTAEGSLYPLTAAGFGQSKQISPLFGKEIRLSGPLPADVSTEGWTLVVAFRDEGAKVTLPVASYELPGTIADWASETVPVGEAKTLEIDDTTLDISLTKMFTNPNDKYRDSTIYVTLKNTGATAVTVPKYRLTLETADGLSYPVAADNFDNMTITPQASKETVLRASVPEEVSLEGARLLISVPVDASDPDSATVPLARFELPASDQGIARIGATAKFTNDDGDYVARLDSIERLPWQDKDILSASFTLSSDSDKALPIPSLAGKFVLDGIVEIPAQIALQNNVAVKRNSDVRFHLFGTIPYDYDISDLKLILQEKNSDNSTHTLLEFAADSVTTEPKTVAVGDSHTTQGSGKRAAMAVNEVRTYSGIGGKEIAALLNFQNLEKRYVDSPALVAYFRTPDGAMYPATISKLEEPITPNSVVTLYVTTKMPGDTRPEELQLIIGEAITAQTGQSGQTGAANNSASSSSNAIGYINAVSFALPYEDTEPKKSFERLEIFPYTLTLRNFEAEVLSRSQFGLSFDYHLEKTQTVSSADEHSLVIEYSDLKGGVVFTKELALGKDNGIPIGEDTMNLIETDQAILYKLPYFEDYVIRIYDKYHGLKKLIAEQTFPWGSE